MRIVLLGRPGAGKGTQAELLTKKLFLTHISTGDMFRAAISADTPLGKEAKSYMDKGLLVPDEITIGIIKDRISQADCREGFILDGFPRTVKQAEALDALLEEMGTSLTSVLDIDYPVEGLVVRLTGRRICRACGSLYHLLYNPPKAEGVCDKCGGVLYQRSDDKEETVKSRLDTYEEMTAPLIAYYEQKGLLSHINGDQPAIKVLQEICDTLGKCQD